LSFEILPGLALSPSAVIFLFVFRNVCLVRYYVVVVLCVFPREVHIFFVKESETSKKSLEQQLLENHKEILKNMGYTESQIKEKIDMLQKIIESKAPKEANKYAKRRK
jgi:molybdopterin-biosynthesis enzyme MoeA-like protein